MRTIDKITIEMSTVSNVYTEVLNGNDLTSVCEHDNYYNYYDSYGAYKNIGLFPEVIPANTFFYSVPTLSFGDYDNSCAVERANVREFLDMYGEFKGVLFHHVTGAYSSESIYVDITCTNTDIIETLNGLLDYPCINDETVSIVEDEIESQYWECLYKSDFLDAIKKKFDGWDIECNDGDRLYSLYTDLKEMSNTYFEVQAGGNGYIDIDRLVNELTELPDFITIELND